VSEKAVKRPVSGVCVAVSMNVMLVVVPQKVAKVASKLFELSLESRLRLLPRHVSALSFVNAMNMNKLLVRGQTFWSAVVARVGLNV
jgi:hypothetical protein